MGAGQVVNSTTDGEVMVWWSAKEKEGVTSTCWPQDIYKVSHDINGLSIEKLT